MSLKRTLKGTKEMSAFAAEIAETVKGKVVLMTGTLGAGKTFLVKNIAEYFGCTDTSSPTFTLHQRYSGDIVIHHFDLYRLASGHELDNIDFYEYIDSGETCFVEWADRFNFNDELENYIEITITVDDPDSRTVTVCEYKD